MPRLSKTDLDIGTAVVDPLTSSNVDSAGTPNQNGSIPYDPKSIEWIRQQLAEAAVRIQTLERTTTRSLYEAKKDIAKFEARIEDAKLKSIETIGIFVGLFSFISIDFTALRNSETLEEASGLILVSGGLILLFVVVMDLVLREWKVGPGRSEKVPKWLNWRFATLFVLISVLVAVGVWLLLAARENPLEDNPQVKLERVLNLPGTIPYP